MSEEARVAGSDTREAASTATVRRAMGAAGFVTGPALAVAFGAPGAWGDEIGFANSLTPWIVIVLVMVSAAVAGVAFRRPLPAGLLVLAEKAEGDDALRLPPGAGAAAVLALGAFVIAASGDDGLARILFVPAPLLGGWTIGRAARLAVEASAPTVAPAAAGMVLAGAFAGVLGTMHLGALAGGSGLGSAAEWSIAYAIAAIAQLFAARLSLPGDRLRANARRLATTATLRSRRDTSQEPLVLEAVTVSFGSNVILRTVDVQAEGGRVVALVGANGAGKSTLLRAAAGFVVPAAGRILVAGEDVTTLRAEERADAGVAFVSGARPIFPDLTVVENLRVAAFRSHPSNRSFVAATKAVLETVPALAFRGRDKAGVLSGGEQRLLAVAMALYRKPSVLLADELSLGLDLPSRISVLDLLRVLADDGVAVMVVDHDLPTLLPRADRAVLLAAGGAQVFDDPVSLLDRRSDLLPATFLAEATR